MTRADLSIILPPCRTRLSTQLTLVIMVTWRFVYASTVLYRYSNAVKSVQRELRNAYQPCRKTPCCAVRDTWPRHQGDPIDDAEPWTSLRRLSAMYNCSTSIHQVSREEVYSTRPSTTSFVPSIPIISHLFLSLPRQAVSVPKPQPSAQPSQLPSD